MEKELKATHNKFERIIIKGKFEKLIEEIKSLEENS